MAWWKPKTTMVEKNEQEWWSTRAVRCDACGEDARHYEARWNEKYKLFTVPYCGHNGGIGREVPQEDNFFRLKDDQVVFLSECCDWPRMRPVKRQF